MCISFIQVPEHRFHSNTRCSDTVASVLTHLFYHLCLQPEHQEKIKEELSQVPGRFDARTLQNCTHLNAVIDETMRLHASVPTGGERLTGAAGLTIDGVFIPPNVAILPARYVLGRSKRPPLIRISEQKRLTLGRSGRLLRESR